MNTTIRVMLVDDQRLMRDGLRTLLELEPDIDVIGEACNGQEALTSYPELQPDVVLMDVRMPGMDGVEATRRLRANWIEAKVIILTTFDEDEYIFEGLRAGALGYLLKAVSGEELANAVRTVAAGNALIDPSITGKVMAEFARLSHRASQPVHTPDAGLPEALTERETEILKLLARGFSNREIAQELFLAEGTVKNYITHHLAEDRGAGSHSSRVTRARVRIVVSYKGR